MRARPPFGSGSANEARCIDYVNGNRERMRYDSCRKRGMQIGSGVVESSCRLIVGLRLKRAGSPVGSSRGRMPLAVKCTLSNMRWVDFMDWKVGMSRAAKLNYF